MAPATRRSLVQRAARCRVWLARGWLQAPWPHLPEHGCRHHVHLVQQQQPPLSRADGLHHLRAWQGREGKRSRGTLLAAPLGIPTRQAPHLARQWRQQSLRPSQLLASNMAACLLFCKHSPSCNHSLAMCQPAHHLQLLAALAAKGHLVTPTLTLTLTLTLALALALALTLTFSDSSLRLPLKATIVKVVMVTPLTPPNCSLLSLVKRATW